MTAKPVSGASDAAQAYLDAAPEPQRTTLLTMWRTLHELLPDAQVTKSYGVPTLKVGGKGVAGVAHYPGHCSYLPMSGSVTATLGEALQGFRTTKGSVLMPVDQPLPDDVLRLLVDARLAELGTTR